MLKKKVSIFTIIPTVMLLGAFALIGIQALKIQELKNNLFSLIPDEKVPKLELVSLENNLLDKSTFSSGAKVLLVFKTPCSVCNPNLNTWNRIAQYFKGKVDVLGIITDGDMEAAQQLESKKVDFQIFLPINEKSFKRKMRLNYNIAQTIVIHDNKVLSVTLGTLADIDLKSILSIIKSKISSH
jgi:hypothetical protein